MGGTRARIGVIRTGEQGAREIAAASRGALDRPLAHAAELRVAVARDEAVLLGAFQRSAELGDAGGAPGSGSDASRLLLLRRGSGGAEARLGPGSVHVLLSLARPDALVPCDERRILNRHVCPLLRALTAAGALAHYFGRDWVSVGGRPVASVGFAHDASTRRTTFEALIAVSTPHAVRPRRPSFRGHDPATLEESTGRAIDPARLAAALVDAYCDAYDAEADELPTPAPGPAPDDASLADPPWSAVVDEAIGTLGAGPDRTGRLRVGGELLVSRDALARLEDRLDALPPTATSEELGRVVDETLAARGVALEGVRSLASVADLLVRARAAAGRRA